jgi:hypothetical protein
MRHLLTAVLSVTTFCSFLREFPPLSHAGFGDSMKLRSSFLCKAVSPAIYHVCRKVKKLNRPSNASIIDI